MLIPFEEFAAPALVLLHVVAFSISGVLWLLGIALTMTVKQSPVDAGTRTMIASAFLLAGVIAAIGLVSASLTYPAYTFYVDPKLRDAQPYVAFLFDLKLWCAIAASLTGSGTISVAWSMQSRRGAHATLALASASLILLLLSGLLAVLTGTEAYI